MYPSPMENFHLKPFRPLNHFRQIILAVIFLYFLSLQSWLLLKFYKMLFYHHYENFQIYFKARTVSFKGLMSAIYLLFLEAFETLGKSSLANNIAGSG